jgi:hypothetical protein
VPRERDATGHHVHKEIGGMSAAVSLDVRDVSRGPSAELVKERAIAVVMRKHEEFDFVIVPEHKNH